MLRVISGKATQFIVCTGRKNDVVSSSGQLLSSLLVWKPSSGSCSETERGGEKQFKEHRQLYRLVLILKLVLKHQWYCLQLSRNNTVIRFTQLNLKHVQSLKFFLILPSYCTHTISKPKVHQVPSRNSKHAFQKPRLRVMAFLKDNVLTIN